MQSHGSAACDPRVPDDGAEGAPCRVEQEVTAPRALPGEDGFRTAGVVRHQHVGVEQISMDQVAALGAGFDQVAKARLAGQTEGVDLAFPAEGCPPAGNPLARVYVEPLRQPTAPGEVATSGLPVPTNRQVRACRHIEQRCQR
jgi:hypothetical protein